jgi:predicted nucleotidyltransferase
MQKRSELHKIIDSLPEGELGRAKAALLALIESTAVQKDIKRICDRLSEDIRIERIYLFGSRATGVPRPDSDIDLYLVLSDTVKSAVSVVQEARISIVGMSSCSVDIVASTASEFNARSQLPMLEQDVLNKGVRMR